MISSFTLPYCQRFGSEECNLVAGEDAYLHDAEDCAEDGPCETQ